MLTNNDATLKNLPTAEVQREFDNIQNLLAIESFGSDDESRHNLWEERSKLFQELKRRGK
jgi:hypothetical protein